MKRAFISLIAIAVLGGGLYYLSRGSAADAEGEARGGGGGFGRGGFGGPRLPMTVELASVTRGDMTEQLSVVGNLIGQATIEAVPKVSGRLEAVYVKLGDRVTPGQRLAKVEDQEIQQQVNQAKASFDVAGATIRQREADLKLAQTNLDRSRNLFERQLVPKQTFDDTDAKYQAAVASLDLARAQYAQAKARLDELNINLANTVITSPVSGFIGKRALDPGAWITPSSSFISVVDIDVVRMVANIIEKDIRRVSAGMPAEVTVDAFPGETFEGHIARVSPVLDPATRTAQIEVEVSNPSFRLKPGMYATVNFTVEHKENTLVIPANAVVDLDGKKGVFMAAEGNVAKFQPITLGMTQTAEVEVAGGLTEGMRVVTTGSGALREGDRIVLTGDDGAGNGEHAEQPPAQGQRGQSGRGRRGGGPAGQI
jgi:RND family efflux transporter MFP subunit